MNMNMNMKNGIALIAGAALAAVSLTGCITINAGGGSEGHADSGHMMDDNGGHMGDGHMGDGEGHMGGNADDEGGGMMGAADLDMDTHFLQMMIPHHEQAVEMSALAVTNGASKEVQALAKQIADAQGPEIEQMTEWLTEAGVPVDGGMQMDMGHGMGMMDGMLDEEQMQALKDAKGADFDRLYLTGMIEHHEGAIMMAQMAKQGDDPRVQKLADAIITSQTAEIEQMEKMLD